MLRTLPPIQYYESEYIPPAQELPNPDDVTIRVEDGTYILEGDWLLLVARDINFEDYEARIHFERTLRKSGIFDRLKEMGIQNGDTVSIIILSLNMSNRDSAANSARSPFVAIFRRYFQWSIRPSDINISACSALGGPKLSITRSLISRSGRIDFM